MKQIDGELHWMKWCWLNDDHSETTCMGLDGTTIINGAHSYCLGGDHTLSGGFPLVDCAGNENYHYFRHLFFSSAYNLARQKNGQKTSFGKTKFS